MIIYYISAGITITLIWHLSRDMICRNNNYRIMITILWPWYATYMLINLTPIISKRLLSWIKRKQIPLASEIQTMHEGLNALLRSNGLNCYLIGHGDGTMIIYRLYHIVIGGDEIIVVKLCNREILTHSWQLNKLDIFTTKPKKFHLSNPNAHTELTEWITNET